MRDSVCVLLVRLVADDRGQDAVEYGLLVAAVVTGSVALFPAIVSGMTTMFASWTTSVNAIWEPAPPP